MRPDEQTVADEGEEETPTMEPDEQAVADEGEEEEMHHDRLMALLHDLVRKHGGRRGAARVLGIDRRTVAACMDGRGMSWRMREALERGLEEGVGSAAARQRKRSDALKRRVESLEKELREGLDAVRDEIGKLREDEARRWESLERRLARREAPRESSGSAEAPSAAGQGPEKTPAATRPAAAGVPKRLYPELVTREPAPDDEEVYGDAWPLIDEWRGLWKTHSAGGRGLAWLEVEERVRELEVTMLEEHGLTLPPETMPLTGLWRSSQLNWRRETLREVRRAVAWRRLVKRVLTLGRGGERRFGGRA